MSKKFLLVLGMFLLSFVTMHLFAFEQGIENQNPQLQQLKQKLEQDMQQVKLDREKLKEDLQKVEQDRMEIHKLKRQLINEHRQKKGLKTNNQQNTTSVQ